VKAKLTSGIFHLPGGASYARTRADRCYLSAEAAEADGLRASKR
jgi:methylphosphotriester-DNA--protein-cysteine methyltransferase